MTSINGVDPLIINAIKTKTQKPAIIEAKKVKVSEDQRDEGKGKHRQGYPKKRLKDAVEKLNKILELNKLPLYFQIPINNDAEKVQLLNFDNDNIIAEMDPEKIYQLVTQFNTKGITVDELI